MCTKSDIDPSMKDSANANENSNLNDHDEIHQIDNELIFCNAAKLFVTDMTLSIASALVEAGFSSHASKDPILQQNVRRPMCEMSLKV